LPALPAGYQRLLAFLALRERPATRIVVAETLWPESSDDHAQKCLRTALFRLTRIAHGAIATSLHGLGLADHVAVDIHAVRATAQRWLYSEPTPAGTLADEEIAAFSADLLPIGTTIGLS